QNQGTISPRRSRSTLLPNSFTVCLRSSDADGSASILTCNTGAGPKTHPAVSFHFPERRRTLVSARWPWQLISSECKCAERARVVIEVIHAGNVNPPGL